MMENRFTPSRFKDGYGPVGAWFLLFKAKVQNGLGEFYASGDFAKAELAKYMPYGQSPVTPTYRRSQASRGRKRSSAIQPRRKRCTVRSWMPRASSQAS